MQDMFELWIRFKFIWTILITLCTLIRIQLYLVIPNSEGCMQHACLVHEVPKHEVSAVLSNRVSHLSVEKLYIDSITKDIWKFENEPAHTWTTSTNENGKYLMVEHSCLSVSSIQYPVHLRLIH